MGILVSPTEPPSLRAIGTTTMFPEKYGCDVIWRIHADDKDRAGWVGVQRKEVSDLLASIRDGRLGQQLRQMAGCRIALVIIEGKWRWSTDGELIEQRASSQNTRPWTRKQIAGVLWSIQSKGAWVYFTESLGETIDAVRMFHDWSGKDSHSGLESRTGPEGDSWGRVGYEDWQRHLLMGLPGIGGELASRILDQVGMPIGWESEEYRREVAKVAGIGPKKMAEIERVLGYDVE